MSRCRLVCMVCCLSTLSMGADRIVRLRNGMQLRGSIVELASIDQNGFQAAAGPAIQAKPIWMIDDGLRRIYINQRAMVVPPANLAPADSDQIILLDQKTPDSGGRVVSAVGSILGINPFDEFGRRIFRMQGPKGVVTVHQGITEINPRYVKLEGLVSTQSYVWDMRLATKSFTSQQLYKIFSNWLDLSILENRVKVIRFFIQDRRYAAARMTIEQAIEDFPNTDGLERQLRTLTQQASLQILDEALLRRKSGQEAFAHQMLSNFPRQNVAIETRLKVEDAIKETTDQEKLKQELIEKLQADLAQLGQDKVAALGPLVAEIQRDLNSVTAARLGAYHLRGQDANLPVENKVALAVAGWLMGANSAEQNLAVATSLIEVRRVVTEYLKEQDPVKRAQLLNLLANLEGATPDNIAKIIKTMKPPMTLSAADLDMNIPGLYRVTLPGRGEVAEHSYLIQLPPEYDPLRKYPCVVTLHRPGHTLEQQIAWWSGDHSEAFGRRMGPAARQGFIVIAPQWQTEGLSGYRFTPREHYRVLSALRDAMRKTSIDSDRVFLSGHSAGGSAAWDIGTSHPDLWAGLVMINADPDKHIRHYSPNGKYVPVYFVIGELSGHPVPLIRNGAVLERYLKPGFDAMLVSYRGRGEEDFHEEIDDIIDWMLLPSHRRKEDPKRIETVTMRSGDQFFWWLELSDLKPTLDISPLMWNHAERLRAGEIRAQITAVGDIQITSIPSIGCSVLVRPEMGISMTAPVRFSLRRKSMSYTFGGNVDFMLEDVRTRADRQKFYWDRVDLR